MSARKGARSGIQCPAEHLCGQCRELKCKTAILAQAISSGASVEKLEGRIRAICDLRRGIERNVRQLLETGIVDRGEKGSTLARARGYLREAQMLFEEAVQGIEAELQETRESFASVRRARRVVKCYGSALEPG